MGISKSYCRFERNEINLEKAIYNLQLFNIIYKTEHVVDTIKIPESAINNFHDDEIFTKEENKILKQLSEKIKKILRKEKVKVYEKKFLLTEKGRNFVENNSSLQEAWHKQDFRKFYKIIKLIYRNYN